MKSIRSKIYFTVAFKFLVLLTAKSQMLHAPDHVLMKYVAPATENSFKMFREAGIEPVNHALTESESAKVAAAISVLPPLHRKILSTHSHSFSVMHNMPNTALTSPVSGRMTYFPFCSPLYSTSGSLFSVNVFFHYLLFSNQFTIDGIFLSKPKGAMVWALPAELSAMAGLPAELVAMAGASPCQWMLAGLPAKF